MLVTPNMLHGPGDELNGFVGTTQYFRHPLGVLYAEGVQYLAERVGAYWLLDLVASHQPALTDTRFQLWEIQTRPDRSGHIGVREDDDQPGLARQEIPYTDFPLEHFKFYVIDGIVLLPSEY